MTGTKAPKPAEGRYWPLALLIAVLGAAVPVATVVSLVLR